MKIENERYNILSKGKNLPEVVPDVDSEVELFVNSKDDKEKRVTLARLKADHIDLLGKTKTDAKSVYVFGKATLKDETLPSVARYSVNSLKEFGEVIGELVAKRMIND